MEHKQNRQNIASIVNKVMTGMTAVAKETKKMVTLPNLASWHDGKNPGHAIFKKGNVDLK